MLEMESGFLEQAAAGAAANGSQIQLTGAGSSQPLLLPSQAQAPAAGLAVARPPPAGSDDDDEDGEEDGEDKEVVEAVEMESNPGCEHVQYGEAVFAKTMCKNCYLEYLKISGLGVAEVGGSELVCGTAIKT